MKIIDGVEFYSISEVSEMVGRSHSTISRVWYGARDYAIENGIHFPFKLPEFRQDLDGRQTRYWDKEGVEALIEFRDNIRSGDLSFYNEKNMWGARGKKIAERKEFKDAVKQELNIDIDELEEN